MKRWLMVWTLLLTLAVVLPHLALASASGGLVDGKDQRIHSGTSGGMPDVEFRAGQGPNNKPWYERAWDAIQDTGSQVGKSISGAWDWTVDAGRSAWHSTTDFLAHPPGWFKGVIGGVIAVGVVLLVAALFALGGWLVVAAAVVAFLASLLYGVLAGDKASVWSAALIGSGAGVAVLAAPTWLAGWRALTLRQILKQAAASGAVNAIAGGLWDVLQGLFGGTPLTADGLVATLAASFVKGFMAGLIFGPVAKGLEFARFPGIAHGSVEWRWHVGFLNLISKTGFAISMKGLLDAAQNKAVTVRQLLGAGLVAAFYSFFRWNLWKHETANRMLEEGAGEGTDRWIGFTITLPPPKQQEPSEPPTQCVPQGTSPR